MDQGPEVDEGLAAHAVRGPKESHATWVAVLFLLLFLVNLAPVVLLASMGEWTRDAFRDPTLLPAVVLVCAAPVVAWAGFLGARRRWHGLLLALLALLTIAWPLFVAWVLLNMLCAAL